VLINAYSELLIRSAAPDELLRRAAAEGIALKNIRRRSEFEIDLTVNEKNLPYLTAICDRSGAELSVLRTKGTALLLKNLKKRYYLMFGLFVCLILLITSSFFIWDIELVGNERLSSAELLRALDGCGVRIGAFWPSLDADSIENTLILQLGDISRLDISAASSRVRVSVREKAELPEQYDKNDYSDITAAKSGVITRLSVLEGKSLAAVGDTVLEGDTLVSGVLESETGDTRYVRARAAIEARTWYELTAAAPLYRCVKGEETARHREYSVIIGKNKINFFHDSRNRQSVCDKIIKYKAMSIEGLLSLPAAFESRLISERETALVQIDREAEAERMKKNLYAELLSRLDGSVTSCTYSVSCTEELITVTLRAECLERIS